MMFYLTNQEEKQGYNKAEICSLQKVYCSKT